MHRLITMGLVLGLLCTGMPYAAAEEEDEKPKGPPKLASEQEVAEALAQFKIDFKARGIPKDDVVSQRNWAMKKLATLHHPEVVATLAKVTKHRNKDLRTLALIYLGDQTLHPYLAAKPILAAMKKHKRDKSMLMTGLQSLCLLKYLGAGKEITALLKHREFAVKKLAISTVGAIKDIRLLKEILRLLGVDVDTTSNQSDSSGSDVGPDGPTKDGPNAPSTPESGGATDSGGGSEGDGGGEESEGGYSWGGVDVFVPQGEDPEAAVRAAQEKNRSAAEAAARGSGGGGGGSAAPSKPSPAKAPGGGSAPAGKAPGGSGLSGGSSRGSAAAARGSEELIPTILLTLKKLTGVKFSEPGSIKLWVTENARVLRAKQKRLDEKEQAQKDAPKKAEHDARKKADAEKAAQAKGAK